MMGILEISVSSALMIIVVLLLRRTLLNTVPKTTFLWLWYIVTARLLIPVRLASPISIENIFQIIRTHQKVYPAFYRPTDIELGYVAEGAIVEHVVGQKTAIMWIVWLVGCVCVSLAFIFCQIVARHNRGQLTPVDDTVRYGLWKEAPIGPRGIQVCYGKDGVSPIVLGLVKPTIVLPPDYLSLSEKERNALFYHELVHVQRRDILFQAAMLVAVAIHWFNPFVWIMYFLALRDIEIACDEAVIKKMGHSEKRFYADLLIDVAGGFKPWLELSTGFGTRDVKERLVSVMKYRDIGKIATLVSAIFVLCVSLVFATVEPQAIHNPVAEIIPSVDELSQNVLEPEPPVAIPLLVKSTLQGRSGTHQVPSNEVVLYVRGTESWPLTSGEEISFSLDTVTQLSEGQIAAIGYVTDEDQEYVPIYFDYLMDMVSLAFTVPTSGHYNFFIYVNSSDPLLVESLYIQKVKE